MFLNKTPVALLAGMAMAGAIVVAPGAFADSTAGRATAWGYNISGQLGNNTTINSSVPLAVSLNPPLAVRRGNAEMPFCLEKMGVLDTSRSQGEGHLLDATVTHTGGIVSVV